MMERKKRKMKMEIEITVILYGAPELISTNLPITNSSF